ncbi:hypothetical protein PGT21_016405 [Puccinia graminis f. sp. tritici]|uniref:Uncharacterized protein n=1 Tax=Puccinia graminis f. sp. tritici TaxID=56615 RepID=A0A5B0PG63_PUCGR|nr:hypothetical protein PGT21_016405 [Puccinia graminis f. sp. tritici]
MTEADSTCDGRYVIAYLEVNSGNIFRIALLYSFEFRIALLPRAIYKNHKPIAQVWFLSATIPYLFLLASRVSPENYRHFSSPSFPLTPYFFFRRFMILFY